jgi:hypothetical protein
MKKFESYDEAKAAKEEAKETLKTAKAELRTFKKENSIKDPEEIEDKKKETENL